MTDQLELELDSVDPALRHRALQQIAWAVENDNIVFPPITNKVNLHCHTFFSYNCYGYSPSRFAYLACQHALAVAAVVDFDVLDGLDEFLGAADMLGLKGFVGMETRVFVPEFADKEMTSPGEPGITYHMGMGFPTAKLDVHLAGFMDNLKEIAQKRNRELAERVNEYLSPVELDYEADVLSLTPSGNATERHLCLAYAQKAGDIFKSKNDLAKFWTGKLRTNAESLDLPCGMETLNAIRAKLMKRGGVGYVKPDAGAFLTMADVSRFVLAARAIPTLTWLNGLSAGEQDIENLLEIAMATGVAAINIIPDRNFSPGLKDEKLKNLYHVVELAEKMNLPVVVGTEMNSPGQKFVDDFSSAELSPLVPVFMKGAFIVYAHSILQKYCSVGYVGRWAEGNFKSTSEKNKFFKAVGALPYACREKLKAAFIQQPDDVEPEQILDIMKAY